MKKKETFHLMAVPRHIAKTVLKSGGRFLRLKGKWWKNTSRFELIQQEDAQDDLIHILDPEQYRSYEMLGEDIEENLSLCKTVFVHKETQNYRTFTGDWKQSNCEECQTILQRLKESS